MWLHFDCVGSRARPSSTTTYVFVYPEESTAIPDLIDRGSTRIVELSQQDFETRPGCSKGQQQCDRGTRSDFVDDGNELEVLKNVLQGSHVG